MAYDKEAAKKLKEELKKMNLEKEQEILKYENTVNEICEELYKRKLENNQILIIARAIIRKINNEERNKETPEEEEE